MIDNDEAIVMGGISTTNMTLFHQLRFRVGDPLACAEVATSGGGRRRTLIVRDIELGRAKQHARADVFAVPGDFVPAAGQSAERDVATAQALAECLRRAKVKRAVCDRTFPALFAHELGAAGIALRCDPGLFQSARRSKDSAERQAMHEAQCMTQDAIELACRMIARAAVNAKGELLHEGAPLTSERVRGAIDQFFAARGYENPRSIVAGGKQGADCHHDGEGVLRSGELVMVDIFPRSKASGYWGDCTRTLVHGKVPAQAAKMHQAVVAAKAAAVKAARVGALCGDVNAETLRVIHEQGFSSGTPPMDAPDSWCGMVHGTGHGLGLDVHEPPLVDRGGPALVEGDVITIEPGLYSKSIGGVRIEDAYVIEAAGARRLGRALPEGLDWS
ncbi:MAG: M24 family metallopeptidase [Planctomycetes bacterium]|nr:M24 family metallopeptidase [Planctomycetota bacterium]